MKWIISIFFMLTSVVVFSQNNNSRKDFLEYLSRQVDQGDLEEVEFLVKKALDTAVDPKFIVDAKFNLVKVLKNQERTEEYKYVLEEINTITTQNNLWEEYYYYRQLNVDYLLDKDRYNEAITSLKDLELYIDKKKLKNPEIKRLGIGTNLLSVYGIINDTAALQSTSIKLYNLLKVTDSLNPKNYTSIARASINYGDYLDTNFKDESFKWYKKGNKYAHLAQSQYLINFSRLRIAGSLNVKKRSEEALDTLRQIQRDPSLDLNTRYLMYDVFTTSFKLLNQNDSVKVYEVLRDELDEIINYIEDKKSAHHVVHNEIENDFNLPILISILSCVFGFGIFIYVFYKSRK